MKSSFLFFRVLICVRCASRCSRVSLYAKIYPHLGTDVSCSLAAAKPRALPRQRPRENFPAKSWLLLLLLMLCFIFRPLCVSLLFRHFKCSTKYIFDSETLKLKHTKNNDDDNNNNSSNWTRIPIENERRNEEIGKMLLSMSPRSDKGISWIYTIDICFFFVFSVVRLFVFFLRSLSI